MLEKRVGIITFHASNNYGSVLQAYALKRVVEKLGFRVSIINYQTIGQQNLYAFPKPNNSIKNIVRNILALPYRKQLQNRIDKFSSFREKNLDLTALYHCLDEMRTLNMDFDYFIAGSDQIWKPFIVDYSDAYMLSFVNDKRKCVSYAASLAMPNIPHEYYDLFRMNLSGFKAISIREMDCQSDLSFLLNRNVEVMPDPVLLLPAEEWAMLSEDEKFNRAPYVLGYFLRHSPKMQSFAYKYAKSAGLEYNTIHYTSRGTICRGRKEYSLGPAGFVSAIKNAELVVTNSFHALAFSIIFSKKVCIELEKGVSLNANSRITTVLQNAYPGVDFNLNDIIDFSRYRKYLRIDEYSKGGISFLERSLDVVPEDAK